MDLKEQAASIAEMRNRREDGALLIQISRHTWDTCLAVADGCLKLAKFKEYVHARLDAAGVPTDPESLHKAEGCRIGGRLDVVLAQLAVVPVLIAACEMWEKGFADGDSWNHIQLLQWMNANRRAARAAVATAKGTLHAEHPREDRP